MKNQEAVSNSSMIGGLLDFASESGTYENEGTNALRWGIVSSIENLGCSSGSDEEDGLWSQGVLSYAQMKDQKESRRGKSTCRKQMAAGSRRERRSWVSRRLLPPGFEKMSLSIFSFS